MAKETQWVKVSGYLFLLGVIIAVIAGLAPIAIPPSTTAMVLLVLGTIVGLLSAAKLGTISTDDAEAYLLSVIALVVVGANTAFLGALPMIGTYVAGIINNIAALAMPAAVILAVEAIWRSGAGKFARF
ncbi:MAG: hypothetical protein V1887_03905 [Candidatus Aenigmatarchaeota archaeon]